MLLPFAAPMVSAADSGQVQITLMQLAKTDGDVIFTIVVKNAGTKIVDVIQVTVDGESPFNITIPYEGLQPGASACGAHSLTGDYAIGGSYPVAVTATFSDHSITTLVQSVICTAGSPRNVGVHLGDWFNYSVTISGNDILPPDNFMVGLEWDLVQVTSVSGTNVTEQATRHYQNGSEIIINGWVDVNTGESSARAYGDFIAANLSVGDAVYTNFPYDMVITATEPRAYPDGTRETNYAGSACWDRSTGAIVESLLQEGADTTIQFTLVDSGVWVVRARARAISRGLGVNWK